MVTLIITLVTKSHDPSSTLLGGLFKEASSPTPLPPTTLRVPGRGRGVGVLKNTPLPPTTLRVPMG